MSRRFDLRTRHRENEGIKAHGCEFDRVVVLSWIGLYVNAEILPSLLAIEHKYPDMIIEWDDDRD